MIVQCLFQTILPIVFVIIPTFIFGLSIAFHIDNIDLIKVELCYQILDANKN